MLMFNLIEYSDNYSKTSGSLADSESFKSKIETVGKTAAGGNEEDVEIMVPLKYLSNFGELLKCF